MPACRQVGTKMEVTLMTEKACRRPEEELREAFMEAKMAGAINLQMEDPTRQWDARERATAALLRLAVLVANTPGDIVGKVLPIKSKPDGSISIENGQSSPDRETP